MAEQDVQKLMQFFLMGQRARQAKESSESEKERLKLAKEEAALRARAAKFEEAKFEFQSKQGTAAPGVELAGPSATGMGGRQGEQIPGAQPEPGIDFPIPGRHEAIELPGGGSVQPQTLEELVASLTAQSGAKNTRPIQPELAGHLGLPEGVTELPSNISGSLPPPPVDVTEGMAEGLDIGPGPQQKEMVDVAVEMFKEEGRNKRSGAQIAGAQQRANTMAGSMGGDSVQNWAMMLNTGQRKPSDIPTGLRGAVTEHMIQRKMGTMTPQIKVKLDQFNSATGALDSIANDLDKYNQAKEAGDVSAAWKAGLQYMVDSSALSRLVGRGMGEKGVFTDQDAATFTALISLNPALAAVNPSMAQDRLRSAYRTMSNVKTRELEGFEQLTGGFTLPTSGEIPIPESLGGMPTSGVLSTGLEWELAPEEEP